MSLGVPSDSNPNWRRATPEEVREIERQRLDLEIYYSNKVFEKINPIIRKTSDRLQALKQRYIATGQDLQEVYDLIDEFNRRHNSDYEGGSDPCA